MEEKFYTGIGARNTPSNILIEFESIGKTLAELGYTLRSGGANGADSAFEKGCKSVNINNGFGGNRNIFLPWENFNNNKSKRFYISQEEYELGKKYYEMSNKSWKNINIAFKKLMSRNIYQVLGTKPISNPKPSDFIICWTKNGEIVGGTSQALRVAKDFNIKIYNFGNNSDKIEFYDFLNKLK